MILGINACRARSGGAIAHLVGILNQVTPAEFGMHVVHVWSHTKLLAALPEVEWLIKHAPPDLERSLARQLLWERFSLPGELQKVDCSMLLNVDAGSICRFQPAVTMSRDMLSYEPGEMRRYGITRAWLRLLFLQYVQARSLKRANGVIFLTNYAAKVIQEFTGPLPNFAVIPHGVGEAFRRRSADAIRPWPPGAAIRCVYVSNTEMYKHQWEVVRAIADLRRRGHPIVLTLAGGGEGRAQRKLNDEIAVTDPQHEFVRMVGAIAHDRLPDLLAESDIFVFASSCESMPNTLVEAMAGGLPIACSDRGPMPEIMQDAGTYFNPEESGSIAQAVEKLILEESFRQSAAKKAKVLSDQYSWERCARETWKFLAKTRENAIMLEH